MTAEQAVYKAIVESVDAPSFLAALDAAGFVVVPKVATEETEPRWCHCGGFTYVLRALVNGGDRFSVVCDNARCDGASSPSFNTRRKAVTDWNTRQAAMLAARPR